MRNRYSVSVRSVRSAAADRAHSLRYLRRASGATRGILSGVVARVLRSRMECMERREGEARRVRRARCRARICAFSASCTHTAISVYAMIWRVLVVCCCQHGTRYDWMPCSRILGLQRLLRQSSVVFFVVASMEQARLDAVLQNLLPLVPPCTRGGDLLCRGGVHV
jgi:hypothetical protein